MDDRGNSRREERSTNTVLSTVWASAGAGGCDEPVRKAAVVAGEGRCGTTVVVLVFSGGIGNLLCRFLGGVVILG